MASECDRLKREAKKRIAISAVQGGIGIPEESFKFLSEVVADYFSGNSSPERDLSLALKSGKGKMEEYSPFFTGAMYMNAGKGFLGRAIFDPGIDREHYLDLAKTLFYEGAEIASRPEDAVFDPVIMKLMEGMSGVKNVGEIRARYEEKNSDVLERAMLNERRTTSYLYDLCMDLNKGLERYVPVLEWVGDVRKPWGGECRRVA